MQIMTKTAFLLVFLFVASLVAGSATRRIAWNPKERPRLQLTQAIQLAHQALNVKEGLASDDGSFYCVSAMLAITTSQDGDWTFIYGSLEKGQRWVIVDFNGQVDVRKEAPFY